MKVFLSKLGLLSCLFGAFSASYAADVKKDDVSPTVLYQAIDVLTSYLEEDISEISKVAMKTALVNYTQSEELPESVKAYVIKKLEQVGGNNPNSPVRFVQCIECLTVRAEAQGDEVFIKKGITDSKELNATLDRLGVRQYSDVNLTYGGRFVSLQMSMVDKEGNVSWSKEYRTPYNNANDSQWMLGAGIEAVSFSDSKLPSPKAARIYFGQRLFGLGAVGLAGSFYEKTKGLSSISNYTGFFELSHNEIFDQYWSLMQLGYVVELGVTDFNGSQQLAEAVGLKMKFGQYFTMRLAAHMNQVLDKPKDVAPVFAGKDRKPILNNDDPLPTHYTLGVGFELL